MGAFKGSTSNNMGQWEEERENYTLELFNLYRGKAKFCLQLSLPAPQI